ncbi:methionyl-tRNA formyltransferase [Vibrio hepatarius]|uniref:methionyl-tRNA formyltransferase n=1 Tax=Vibrio hepatarius TaxID=171383 RepID=UPI001C083713|nr:formyltransferase family protein [Vibrio hepatarius]MBU2896867.1 hypothetical protein [Vibrio hepatarius]
MRAGFIGCVDSSRAALQTLLGVEGLTIATVVTKEKSTVNSDFCDIKYICEVNNIPYQIELPNAQEETADFLAGFDLDIVFCIGWSYLLSKRVLDVPKMGVIGYHPAQLPSNRGRHPIIWALVLGLEETASTFFLMDEGADSGPIISQVPIPIEVRDNATSLYKKILDSSQIQLGKLASDLVSGTISYSEQDHSQATYWRKRSRRDGVIDFRMSAESIHNLVRALAPPYPGAEMKYNDQCITVQRSVLSFEEFPRDIEPGKVLSKQGNGLLIKTSGTGAIWLYTPNENQLEVGEHI